MTLQEGNIPPVVDVHPFLETQAMAHLITIHTTTPVLGQAVEVNSYGYNYYGTIVELKPRTMRVEYVNKGGARKVAHVKRTDVAAPTAAQKDATERGVKTRTLKNDIRCATWDINHLMNSKARSLESINESRAADRAERAALGRAIVDWVLPMTEAEYATRQAELTSLIETRLARLAKLEAELEAHLGTSQVAAAVEA